MKRAYKRRRNVKPLNPRSMRYTGHHHLRIHLCVAAVASFEEDSRRGVCNPQPGGDKSQWAHAFDIIVKEVQAEVILEWTPNTSSGHEWDNEFTKNVFQTMCKNFLWNKIYLYVGHVKQIGILVNIPLKYHTTGVSWYKSSGKARLPKEKTFWKVLAKRPLFQD